VLHVENRFGVYFFDILVVGIKERMHLFFVDWRVNRQWALLREETPSLLLRLYHLSECPDPISFMLGLKGRLSLEVVPETLFDHHPAFEDIYEISGIDL
jgi:hypothetical protein